MPARLACTALLLLAAAVLRAEDYLDRAQFLALAFPAQQPEQRTLWVDATLRQRTQDALGFAPPGLRVRYWSAAGRTAWILDEIGKERPITFGIVVEQQRIVAVRVMAFRESRGGEIRYPFFSEQYAGAALGADGALDRPIDGITGATLSVRASGRAARLALWLDAQAETGVATR
jgi:hypothetical protein